MPTTLHSLPMTYLTSVGAPNKVGCLTATPNGSTVGQSVQNGRAQLQAVIDRQNELAAAGGDVNPLAFASAFFSIVKPNGPIDFKKGQAGQTFVQMGLAVTSPTMQSELPTLFPARSMQGPGAYAVTAAALFPHSTVHFSDRTGNFLSDSAAAHMRGPGRAANGCSIP